MRKFNMQCCVSFVLFIFTFGLTANGCDDSDCYDDRDDVQSSLSSGGGRYICRELDEYLDCLKENLRECPNDYSSAISIIRNQWQQQITRCSIALPFDDSLDVNSDEIVRDFSTNDVVENVLDTAENVVDFKGDYVDSQKDFHEEVLDVSGDVNHVTERVDDHVEQAREYIEDVIENALNPQLEAKSDLKDNIEEARNEIVEHIDDIVHGDSAEDVVENIVDKIATQLDDPHNSMDSPEKDYDSSEEVTDAVTGKLGNMNVPDSDSDEDITSDHDVNDIAEDFIEALRTGNMNDFVDDSSENADDGSENADDSSESTGVVDYLNDESSDRDVSDEDDGESDDYWSEESSEEDDYYDDCYDGSCHYDEQNEYSDELFTSRDIDDLLDNENSSESSEIKSIDEEDLWDDYLESDENDVDDDSKIDEHESSESKKDSDSQNDDHESSEEEDGNRLDNLVNPSVGSANGNPDSRQRVSTRGLHHAHSDFYGYSQAPSLSSHFIVSLSIVFCLLLNVL